jgi:hypothetical protein
MVEGEQGHGAQTSKLAARPGALLLDYLRVRVPDDRDTWRALAGWLGVMVNRGCGWRGWYSDSATVLDGGLVAWCQGPRRETWGVLVDLPGKACAAMGDRLLPFLRWALEHGKVTRADFAIDDRAGHLTLERIVGSVRSGALACRYEQKTVIEGLGKRGGWTVYFGSRAGQSMVRVYDKRAEQLAKGRDVAGAWVRVELEARQEFGDALCRDYFERGSVAVIEQLNRRLRFVDLGVTRACRAPTATWWAEVIGSVAVGHSLTLGEAPVCTLASLAAFVEKQAGPALVTLVKGAGGDLGQLLGILDRSAHRLKPKHFSALALRGGAA